MPHYILSKVSVNCLVKKGDKILLVQQARPDHARGKWSVPGGKVDEGENFHDAVRREMKEEVGLDISAIKPIGIIHEAPYKTVKHIFLVSVEKGEIKFNESEILDVKWFTLNEIKEMGKSSLLRGEWIQQAIDLIFLQ